MDATGKFLIVVAGPTAVGKTDLSIKLAQHFNTEIISADSRQFFRELSIGTAKPTTEEQQGIKHHFIDSHSITETYNAGRFETEALAILDNLFTTREVIIATGGSGLYIRALCEGMDEMPEIITGIREKLNAAYSEKGIEFLQQELQCFDPDFYNSVDRSNPARLIRALEVCIASGKPYSSFRQQKSKPRLFQTIKIGLYRNREELYQRIDLRMDQMLRQGLLEEVKSLLPYRNHQALQTVGYSEIFDFLTGKYDWEETVRLLKRNSRRYAKRQLTWFRKDSEIKWFEPDDFDAIAAYIDLEIKLRKTNN